MGIKFFVTSDIHSYLTPLIKALDKAGFNPNDELHWLIICGDCFDRGHESKNLLKYLMSLKRKIIIKGNHDILLERLYERGYPYRYDYSNGTVQTMWDIGAGADTIDDVYDYAYNLLKPYRNELKNYFETQKYIFVHSWIPTKYIERSDADGVKLIEHKFNPEWRDANDIEWEDAMWVNPFEQWQSGLNQTGKTIIFGHWHCSTGHKISGATSLEYDKWEPFYGDNIIAIDRCTAYTGDVNVIVLEDDFI